MKNYIDRQQHLKDGVNADYDYMEAMKKLTYTIILALAITTIILNIIKLFN